MLPPLGAGQGEETRRANRVSITQVPALPCSPAPHTRTCSTGSPAERSRGAGPCTGSTAADTLLLPRGLCPSCCPRGSAVGSAMSLRKQAGARLSLWQDTLWEGPGLYSCSMAARWGWCEALSIVEWLALNRPPTLDYELFSGLLGVKDALVWSDCRWGWGG